MATLSSARIGVALLALASIGLAEPLMSCRSGGTCDYAGHTYDDGATFLCPDGCNQCTCGADGTIVSTKKKCATGAVAGCEYNGQAYRENESFPDMDGCNTCSCMAGVVACTLMFCPGDAGASRDAALDGDSSQDAAGNGDASRDSDGPSHDAADDASDGS